MDKPLDTETRALLEVLAEGVSNEEQRCWWCGAQVTLYTQEVHAHLHTNICPTHRARARLALNGTPAKMWIISFVHRRSDRSNLVNGSLRVVKSELSEDDALKLVVAQYQEKRYVVESSIKIQEVGTVI